MFINSVQNNDSEQCTKSKMGWVHQVHTLTQAARPLRSGRAHSALWAPCRGVHWAVSWPPPRPYRGRARPCRYAHESAGMPCRNVVSLPSVTIQKLYRDPRSYYMLPRVSQPPAPYHGAPWPCRKVVSLAVSQPCCASCHDTTHCIATHFASQAARTRCLTPLRAVGRIVASLGRVATLPWWYRGRG